MTSSALTGNTSGLASATSPGLVGITTQTFAGKKTLDGGALIKGDTSGAAIAASYVGEVKAVTGAFFNASSGAWNSNATSLTLNSGNWLVSGSMSWIRNAATIASFEIAAAVVGVTTPATIQTDFSSKYNLRTGFDLQTGLSNSFSVLTTAIPSFYLRSDGTNLYFSDGTTMYSSGQVITFAHYCSAFSVATPQFAGQITAIRIA